MRFAKVGIRIGQQCFVNSVSIGVHDPVHGGHRFFTQRQLPLAVAICCRRQDPLLETGQVHMELPMGVLKQITEVTQDCVAVLFGQSAKAISALE